MPVCNSTGLADIFAPFMNLPEAFGLPSNCAPPRLRCSGTSVSSPTRNSSRNRARRRATIVDSFGATRDRVGSAQEPS